MQISKQSPQAGIEQNGSQQGLKRQFDSDVAGCPFEARRRAQNRPHIGTAFSSPVKGNKNDTIQTDNISRFS